MVKRSQKLFSVDHVFGRIEQKLNPKALIPSPLQYYIFRQFGRVKQLTKDWSLYDHKEFASRILLKSVSLHTREACLDVYWWKVWYLDNLCCESIMDERR